MSRVVVIGAGVMGLAAAYQALLDGHEVDVLEASSEPGGMAAHFDFGGISIERFYHFVCRSDHPTFQLMAELGIADKLHWVPTSMGLLPSGTTASLGRSDFPAETPRVGLIGKLRYGFFVLACMRQSAWPDLENKSAKEWIIGYCGERHLQPILAAICCNTSITNMRTISPPHGYGPASEGLENREKA